MAPTILIVGATGNTGRSVVETLPRLLKNNPSLSQHRILALTRSKESPAAQKLAAVPTVEVAEQHWNEITAEWFREHEVERVFIAAHTGASAFAEEGQFHIEAKRAGVKYVVRISTTAANVKQTAPRTIPVRTGLSSRCSASQNSKRCIGPRFSLTSSFLSSLARLRSSSSNTVKLESMVIFRSCSTPTPRRV